MSRITVESLEAMQRENPSVFKKTRRRGGVRKQRADEYVVDQLLTRSDRIMAAIDDALEDENPVVRLRAVKMCFDIQDSVDQRRFREQERADNLSQHELRQTIMATVSRLVKAGAIDTDTRAIEGAVIDLAAEEVHEQ